MERFLVRGGQLAPGMDAPTLARCLQLAEHGAKAAMAEPGTLADLECVTGLLVRGALAQDNREGKA